MNRKADHLSYVQASLSIHSEIGGLKTVLLHRPGEELLNLSPQNLGRLLFDDIPFLTIAQEEHDVFAQMLKNEGVEVLYLETLTAEALEADASAKDSFIESYLASCGLKGHVILKAAKAYLESIENTKELVKKAISGIRIDDLDMSLARGATLSDLTSIDDSSVEHLLIDPIPNLYFTRDTFSVIGDSVSINSMTTPTRRRESIFAEAIFNHHPSYKHTQLVYTPKDSARIEGGDILVFSKDTIGIGVSERTEAAAIDCIAQRLLWADEGSRLKRVLAFAIPKTRAFMHLDTVFTQVDVDTFTVHPNILLQMEVFELTRASAQGDVSVRRLEEKLEDILAKALELDAVKLIKCGGEDPIAAAREQWNDGSNTLAVKPGRVFVYQRNSVTNEILYKEGLELLEIPSAELSRGRGGPHCMSMAFVRDELV